MWLQSCWSSRPARAAGVGAQVWHSQGRPSCALPQALPCLSGSGPWGAPGNGWSERVPVLLLCHCCPLPGGQEASKALFSAGAYTSFAREAAGAAQSGVCCLALPMSAEIRPWAGGFSPPLLLTLLFLPLLAHRVTFEGASASPAVSLQELLLAEASLPSMLLKLWPRGWACRWPAP